MSITSSTIVSESVQADGRRYITERHRRDDGPDIIVEYLADADLDAGTIMLARVALLEAQSAQEVTEAHARDLLNKFQQKRDAFLDAMDNVELKATLGLTDDELNAVRPSDAVGGV